MVSVLNPTIDALQELLSRVSSTLGDHSLGDDVTRHHDNHKCMINFIIKPLTQLIAVHHDMKKVV